MEQTKIYIVVKVEVKDGCDAINLLITTNDKEKAQKRFKREVSLDKKTNSYWQNGNRELFDDMDDEYCVYDENDYGLNHTLILLKETILK